MFVAIEMMRGLVAGRMSYVLACAGEPGTTLNVDVSGQEENKGVGRRTRVGKERHVHDALAITIPIVWHHCLSSTPISSVLDSESSETGKYTAMITEPCFCSPYFDFGILSCCHLPSRPHVRQYLGSSQRSDFEIYEDYYEHA